MGCGSFTTSSFAKYSRSTGKTYDSDTGRVSGQTYTKHSIDEDLKPYKVMRECCNTDEHPNTIPVILALDVTGSMGSACKETAEALGNIMTELYTKYKDVQIMVMGIGDLAYDDAPIQISQFESDVRIAEWLDKIWMEHGGGGNAFESYTAAWYMGLYHTKLDCFDKQGRKGIIITMGDEPLNPYLSHWRLNKATGDTLQADIETPELYKEVCRKFDVFHIAVDASDDSYLHYAGRIKNSFGELLGQRYVVSTIENLGSTICDCIDNATGSSESFLETSPVNSETIAISSDGISW